MKKILCSLALIASFSVFADTSIDRFKGKTFKGDGYTLIINSDVSEDGNLKGTMKKGWLGKSDNVEKLVVVDNRLVGYYDLKTDQALFNGFSLVIYDENKLSLCRPYPHQDRCLEEK